MNEREQLAADAFERQLRDEHRRQRCAVVSAIVIVLALVSGVVGTVALFESASCSKSWEGSGMRSKWRGVIVGCLVEVKPGMWVPEERVRLLGDE